MRQWRGNSLHQFAEGGELNPARIVSLFSDEESQRQVAEIFNTNVQGDGNRCRLGKGNPRDRWFASSRTAWSRGGAI